jgi:GNAT superfamily N-acetyltransferase
MIPFTSSDTGKIRETAACFAESFLADEGLISSCLNRKEAETYFFLLLKEYIRIRAVYASSEKEEGYIIFHRKKQGIPWYRELSLFVSYLRFLPFSAMQKLILAQRDWEDYSITFSNLPDYVDVSFICVRPEYRHQGFFRRLMQEAFNEADHHGIPCVLDTDSEKKAGRYEHIGMKTYKEKELESGLHMFTCIYEPE